MNRLARWLAALCVCGTIAAPTAAAKLRSPHLESHCDDGFAYGEMTLSNWIVEGCHKEGTPKGDENKRTMFKGEAEVNGMLVDGSKNLLLTRGEQDGHQYTTDSRSGASAQLVLDPKIGGHRRRFVIHDGGFELQLLNTSPPPPGDVNKAHGAIVQGQDDTVDIPIGSDAKLLGMRLSGTIHDAKVSLEQGGSIELKPRLRLGSAASALLRDYESKVQVKTVDGTGMMVTGLNFQIPHIGVPGIGGFDNLHISYDDATDEWSGGVHIDLGDIFPSILFDMSVSASTGAPTAIQLDVSPFNTPLGPTGIYLQELRGGFAVNPLILNSGIGLTAGPEFAGTALVRMDGDIKLQLEPNFRMENTGSVRVFPIGADSQIARGDGHVILDSRGYLSIGADAGFQVAVFGIGAGADIDGNGAYSTTSDAFNIEATATGSILLGSIGSFDIVRFEAAVSSNGWGTCGKLLLFLTAGVGQQWDHNPKVILTCDLSQFEDHVPDPAGHRSAVAPRATGDRALTFTVAPDTKRFALEIHADGPEPHTGLYGPDNALVGATVTVNPLRAVNDNVIVSAPAGSDTQYIFLKDPAPGQYTLRWEDTGAQVNGLRFARDLPPLSATAAVSRGSQPGRRVLRVSNVKGLSTGDILALGVRTPNGVMPIGQSDGSEAMNMQFREVIDGGHDIVGSIVRDGIPLPGTETVLGTYQAALPPAPRALDVTHDGTAISVLGKPRKGAELPDAWQYVASSQDRVFGFGQAAPGHRVKLEVPEGYDDVTVVVRPVVDGKVLAGKVLNRHIS